MEIENEDSKDDGVELQVLFDELDAVFAKYKIDTFTKLIYLPMFCADFVFFESGYQDSYFKRHFILEFNRQIRENEKGFKKYKEEEKAGKFEKSKDE